jgi:hypothetical protein
MNQNQRKELKSNEYWEQKTLLFALVNTDKERNVEVGCGESGLWILIQIFEFFAF